jgi:hypothetical protein
MRQILSQTSLIALVIICNALLITGASGQSNIDSANKFAWGENIGWCDFYADGTNGVVVSDHYLSGFVWMENVGWLFLGDGSPNGGSQYLQTSGDTGINNDDGNLSGYAWGENIGWVVFDPSGSGQQVSIDSSGNFSGYAWSENVGWINMASGYGVETIWESGPTPTISLGMDNSIWSIYQ